MKKIIVLFTLVAIVLIGCDVIGSLGGGSKKTNSYMKFEINELIFDTRESDLENADLSARLLNNGIKDFLFTTVSKIRKLSSPYNFKLSLNLYYTEDQQIFNVKPTDSVFWNLNTPRQLLFASESSGDVSVGMYKPIINEENQLHYQVLDTLGSKYIMGSLTSWMAKDQFNRNGTLPDTFKVERGEFFVEIIDQREE